MKYFIFVVLLILVILVILVTFQPISLGLPTSAGARGAGFTPLATGWLAGWLANHKISQAARMRPSHTHHSVEVSARMPPCEGVMPSNASRSRASLRKGQKHCL